MLFFPFPLDFFSGALKAFLSSMTPSSFPLSSVPKKARICYTREFRLLRPMLDPELSFYMSSFSFSF